MLPFYISVYSAVIGTIYFLLPLYLKGSLHFSEGQIGLLFAVLSLNAILISFPVGVIGDRYPARILTRVGLAATAASLWGLASVVNFLPVRYPKPFSLTGDAVISKLCGGPGWLTGRHEGADYP